MTALSNEWQSVKRLARLARQFCGRARSVIVTSARNTTLKEEHAMRSLVTSRLITISVSIILTTALLVSALIRHAPRVAAQGSPACVAPPSGLVSWWPGDGNANDIQGSYS